MDLFIGEGWVKNPIVHRTTTTHSKFTITWLVERRNEMFKATMGQDMERKSFQLL